MRAISQALHSLAFRATLHSTMEHRRAIMINAASGRPVDPLWQPYLAIDELPLANERMARNGLTFVWQWIPMSQSLSGSAVLSST